MSENNINNSNNKKKGARASIAAMDYGFGSVTNANNSFGTGKAARSLVSGPLANSEAKIVELNLIDSNPDQPRLHFDKVKLQELADDIKDRGILQPPIIRPTNKGRYEIVAGERRCRAARMVGLIEIPVIIKEFKSEQEARLVSLAENLQRDDLDIEDEARFLSILQKEMKLSLRQIAEVIHRSHLYVHRRLKIAEEPDLMELYRKGYAGIETLGRIADIPKDHQEERAKAIEALKSDKNKIEEKEAEASGSDFSRRKEPTFSVTAHNSVKPIYRLGLALSNIRLEGLLEEEKQTLVGAISELESVLTEVRRKLQGDWSG